MKLYVYKIERQREYKNEAETLSYDYTKDFEELKSLRGYTWIDYYITDTHDLKPNKVYYTGDLIKVTEKVAEFDGDPITVIPVK